MHTPLSVRLFCLECTERQKTAHALSCDKLSRLGRVLLQAKGSVQRVIFSWRYDVKLKLIIKINAKCNLCKIIILLAQHNKADKCPFPLIYNMINLRQQYIL